MKIIGCVCVFLCLCSCSENKLIAEKLNQAEEIVNDYPDSVLNILQTIDVGDIHKKSSHAKYGLLYSLALDKTGNSIPDNSMIRSAANFYLRKGTKHQQALSLYCLGRIEDAANNYQEAVSRYLAALDCESQLNDPYFAGVCNYSIGDLYLKQNSYQLALSYYEKAVENYKAANKAKHHITTKTAIASVYYIEGEADNAQRNYLEALSLAEQADYKDMQVYCLRCIISILSDAGKTEEIKDYATRFLKLSENLSASDYCVLGEYYLRVNMPDRAEPFFNTAIAVDGDRPSRTGAAAKALLAETYVMKGDYKTAYKMQSECFRLSDSIHLCYMNNSAAEAELQYKNERLEFERYRSGVKQKFIYFIIFASAVAIFGIVYIHRRRNRKQERRIAEYLTLIDELNRTKLQMPDTSKINELFNTRFYVVKELARTYYEYGNSPALSKKVKEILSERILDQTVMADLENTLNQQYDDVILKFHAEYPKIKPCFVELLCLLYAGFSPQQISVITNETLTTVYMRKFHLKQKIAASNLPNKDAIIDKIL